jgi:hypothetical protein
MPCPAHDSATKLLPRPPVFCYNLRVQFNFLKEERDGKKNRTKEGSTQGQVAKRPSATEAESQDRQAPQEQEADESEKAAPAVSGTFAKVDEIARICKFDVFRRAPILGD